VAIALAIIVATTLFYYYNSYQACTAHRTLRERLVDAVAQAGRTPVILADVVEYDWAKVSILAERELQGRRVDCPLGWDWSWEERTQLARDGDLVVMVFSSTANAYVDFLDVQRSAVDFAVLPAQYTREEARFTVTPSDGDPERYTLEAKP
jgi:hypothetical protein